MSAKYYPHLVRADTSVLAGQFSLHASRPAHPLPVGWEVDSLGSWTLANHPALPRTPLLDAGGQPVGWLLGDCVGENGLVRGPLSLPADTNWEDGCERLLASVSGRFVLIVVAGPRPRVYPDALGMLATVFAPALGAVASTTTLLPLSASTAFDVPRILAVGAPYRDSMYPLGLTHRRGVERLMPNHYLDLSEWRLVRRWPLGDVPFDADPLQAQQRVAELASRTIRALAAKYPLLCPITAGRDSRLLLACARDVLERVALFTVELPGEYTGFRDIQIARTIAGKVGLQHTVLRHRRARADDLREWVNRTGGEAGEGRGWHSFTAFKQIERQRFLLNGWAGDVVRPIYWAHTRPDDRVSASNLLSICRVRETPEFLERAERWLDSLPTKNPITTLDLFLMEQRGGCWAGILQYAVSGYTVGNVAPLCNQEVIRTLVSLPEAYRRNCTFEADVIARQWPELAEIPFNEQVPATSLRARYYLARDRLRAIGSRAKADPLGLPGRVLNKLTAAVARVGR